MTDAAADTEREMSAGAAELIARIRGISTASAQPATHDDLRATGFHDRYKLVRELGQGAMGTVWQASDKKLRRTVAVKFLKPDMQKNPIVVERAFAEARAASHARHEHIVEIFDVGTMPDGSIYTVMEWLEGRTLAALLEENVKLPWSRCRGVLLQLAGAMAHAHRCGITHRDLKPDNIFVCARGTLPDFCKVIDFGLSKDAGVDKRLTQTGQLLGTPYYMSPEQVLGRSADPRSDVYGLGVIAFELLTGSRPFEGDSVYQVFAAHVEGAIPQLPDELDTPAHAIDAVIRKSLAKDPEARFASMDELSEAIARIPEEFPRPATLLMTVAMPPSPRRRRWGLPKYAVLVGSLVVGGVAAALMFPPHGPAPERLEEAGGADEVTVPAAGDATSVAPSRAPEVAMPSSEPVVPPTPESATAEVEETSVEDPAAIRGVAGRGRPRTGRPRASGVAKAQPKPVEPVPAPSLPPAATPPPRTKAQALFEEMDKLDGRRDDAKRAKPELLGD